MVSQRSRARGRAPGPRGRHCGHVARRHVVATKSARSRPKFPASNSVFVRYNLQLPTGTAVSITNEVTRRIEQAMMKDPRVPTLARRSARLESSATTRRSPIKRTSRWSSCHSTVETMLPSTCAIGRARSARFRVSARSGAPSTSCRTRFRGARTRSTCRSSVPIFRRSTTSRSLRSFPTSRAFRAFRRRRVRSPRRSRSSTSMSIA